MRRKALIGIVFGALLVTVLVAWAVTKKRPVISEIASPNGELVLRLTGDPTMPMTPFRDHWVYFDLSRNAKPVLADKFLHFGDWLDPSFNFLYTQHRWLSNTTIQFLREAAPEPECDRLVVRNDTDKAISYLLIESRDLFLVFNLDPGSEVKIRSTPQGALTRDLSWIEVEGEFADNRRIDWQGVNFKLRDQKGPFEYHISINAGGAQVTSPQLAEYRGPSTPE